MYLMQRTGVGAAVVRRVAQRARVARAAGAGGGLAGGLAARAAVEAHARGARVARRHGRVAALPRPAGLALALIAAGLNTQLAVLYELHAKRAHQRPGCGNNSDHQMYELQISRCTFSIFMWIPNHLAFC